MALTAEEQALLNSLQAKATEVEKPVVASLEDIVLYLVRTSDKFSANPELRDAFLEFLAPGASASANAEAN